MTARRKKAQAKVTKAKPNTYAKGGNSGAITPKSVLESLPLRSIEVLAVHADRRRGMSHAAIAKKWHLTTNQVQHILRKNTGTLDIPGREIESFMRQLIAKEQILTDRLLDAVSEEDIEDATMSQKVSAAAQLHNQATVADRHIRGTKDKGFVIPTAESRVELERQVKRLAKELGIRDVTEDAQVVVEDAKVEEITRDADQLELFVPREWKETGTPGVMRRRRRKIDAEVDRQPEVREGDA